MSGNTNTQQQEQNQSQEQSSGQSQNSQPQTPQVDLNEIYKKAYNEGKEKAVKDLQQKITSTLGIQSFDELEKLREKLQQDPNKDVNAEYQKQVEALSKELQELRQKHEEAEKRIREEELNRQISEVILKQKPIDEAAADLIRLVIRNKYNIQNGKVFNKDGTPVFINHKEATLEDVILEMKNGQYARLFEVDGNIQHPAGGGTNNSSAGHKITKEELMNKRFIDAIERTGQMSKLLRGEQIDLNAIKAHLGVQA